MNRADRPVLRRGPTPTATPTRILTQLSPEWFSFGDQNAEKVAFSRPTGRGPSSPVWQGDRTRGVNVNANSFNVIGGLFVHLEVWNTVATVGTFVVVLLTGGAALVQLRHLRVNNQLHALLAILSMPMEQRLAEAFEFVTGDFRTSINDETFRAQLADSVAPDRRAHKELRVCDYYERLGSCIKLGLIPERLYFDNSSPERFWEILEPAIALYRIKRGPVAYENFEYLVMRSREWDRKNPYGSYPAGMPRATLPPVDSGSGQS